MLDEREGREEEKEESTPLIGGVSEGEEQKRGRKERRRLITCNLYMNFYYY